MSLLKISIIALTMSIGSASSAIAHDAALASSAALHILSNGEHLSGFFFIGVLVGIFISLAGGWRKSGVIWITAIPFFLLSSDSHVSLIEPGGIIFAIGFLSSGFLIIFLAGNTAAAILRNTNPDEETVKKE
mgnify:CR=1 FL=1